MFLDGDGVNTIKLHSHGTTSPEGVAADIVASEAILVEAQVDDSGFDGAVDVGRCDLTWVPWGFVVGANGCVGVISVCHDVCNSSSKSLNRARGKTCAVVMDALATLAIFLVGDAECDMGGCEKFNEWCIVVNY